MCLLKFLMCLLKLDFPPFILALQNWQVWTVLSWMPKKCDLRIWIFQKLFSQMSHLYCVVLLWMVLKWSPKELLQEYVFPHSMQSTLLFECEFLLWSLKWIGFVKVLSQTLHVAIISLFCEWEVLIWYFSENDYNFELLRLAWSFKGSLAVEKLDPAVTINFY